MPKRSTAELSGPPLKVTGAGFEPAPPKRPELESGALDHSAILSASCGQQQDVTEEQQEGYVAQW